MIGIEVGADRENTRFFSAIHRESASQSPALYTECDHRAPSALQVTHMMKDHLEKAGNWQVVHRMYRHASSASHDTTVKRLFKPRASTIDTSASIEDILGYRFSDRRVMEAAVTHSCAPLRFSTTPAGFFYKKIRQLVLKNVQCLYIRIPSCSSFPPLRSCYISCALFCCKWLRFRLLKYRENHS